MKDTLTLVPGVSVNLAGGIIFRYMGVDDQMKEVDLTLSIDELARNVFALAQATGMAPLEGTRENWSMH